MKIDLRYGKNNFYDYKTFFDVGFCCLSRIIVSFNCVCWLEKLIKYLLCVIMA